MNGREMSRKAASAHPTVRDRLIRWAPTLLWMLLIFVGSARPGRPHPFTEGGLDKLGHLLAYAILAVLSYRCLSRSRKARPLFSHAWRAGLFSALYGLLTELYQISVPGRDFQWSDVAANCLGIALALAVVLYWHTNRSSTAQPVHQNHQGEQQVSNATEITADNFEGEALQADIPVVVDFWAPWCGPCHMISPILESLAEKYAGKIKLGKVNLDEHPQLAAEYGIRSIPAVLIFKDGQVVERVIGVQPEEHLAALIDQVLAQ